MTVKLNIPCRVASGTCYATLECPDTIIVGEGRPNVFTIYSDANASGQTVMALVQGNDGSLVGLFNVAVSPTPQTVTVSFADTNWTVSPGANRIPFSVEGMSISAGENVSTTLYAYATQDMAPDFGIEVSPREGIIQGKTELVASIVGESTKLGASITARSISIGGTSGQGSSLAIIPWQSGYCEIVATITDSRGLSTTHSTSVNVTEYFSPSVSRITLDRVDAEGNSDAEGTRVKVSVDWQRGGDAGGEASCALMYRATGTAEYTDLGAVESGQSYLLDGEFGTDKQYEFVAMVHDNLSAISRTAILEMAFFTMDFLAGGKGMAIGKPATHEGLDVGMESWFDKPIHGTLACFDWDVTGGAVNDTMEFWRALGTGYTFFTQNGMINGQPSQYGILINYVCGSEIHQEWWIQSNGEHYRRGVNGGVHNMPGWYLITDETNTLRVYDTNASDPTNPHWKMTTPSGNGWVKTTNEGIIPNVGGQGEIGCGAEWQFSKIWGYEMFINGIRISDHVFEEGFAGDWHYQKFRNGLCILHGRWNFGFTMKNWKWNSTSNALGVPSFPFPVYNRRTMIAAPNDNYAWPIIHNTDDVWSVGELFLISAYDTTGYKEMQVAFVVIGRWG